MTRLFLAAALPAIALAACGSESPPPVDRPSTDDWFAGVDLAAFLDCAREQEVSLLQAHRAGGRPGAVENSLSAIEASLADGAVFMELDVARTSDGVLVLMHDRTVDRTTTGTGAVAELTYAQIAALRLRDETGAVLDEAPPTLETVLTALDGRGVAQIDRKHAASFDEIAAVLDAADAVDRSLMITYTLDEAIALHERLPGIVLSAGIDTLEDLETLTEAGVETDRISAWLGLGAGDPTLDAALADMGVETSYGDFRAEREGRIDYEVMASNGAEIISVDDVAAAAATLNAAEAARELLAACEAARP
jgi:glycerophosphoryl diester phosphodiesterase